MLKSVIVTLLILMAQTCRTEFYTINGHVYMCTICGHMTMCSG